MAGFRKDWDGAPDLGRGLDMEWLETNGLGGYAMGTRVGARTRRYHGLLCAATRPPVQRTMLLSALEERLRADGQEAALSTNLYGEVVHPEGYRHQVGFRLDPWPVWSYEALGVRLDRSVCMVQGANAVIIEYRCLEAPGPVALVARPLLAWRDHHHLVSSRTDFRVHAELVPRDEALVGSDGPPAALALSGNCDVHLSHGSGEVLHLALDGGRFGGTSEWYYGFTYPQEAARGLDWREDLYSPGEVAWTLRPGEAVRLVASLGERPWSDTAGAMEAERARRNGLSQGMAADDTVGQQLCRAADQFVVVRPDQGPQARSLVAGYPWFTDWGRDTMIALPGLLLTTGRLEEARQVLLTYAESMSDGLIPNTFGDADGQPAYNTVDATLWLFVAARRYQSVSRDLTVFEDGLYDRLQEALAAHLAGTHFGIHADEDGLLAAGDEKTQLTWMDAKVGDWVVTPRHGKAVEINALWYSAVRTMEFLACKLGGDGSGYARLGRAIRSSFVRTFWNDRMGCLYDCVRGQWADAAVRPNQVIALGLPYGALSVAQERSVLRVLTQHLLTPYGLRTLSPEDPDYRGHYGGDPWQRDGAYHQGTVWPWLLGPYVSAYLAHAGRSADARRWVWELIAPLVAHLREAGLGSISEVFDGDAPHRPGGCPAQAWSVGELLRVWVEGRLWEFAPENAQD
jgi:predicted glycogen debranching enzyme